MTVRLIMITVPPPPTAEPLARHRAALNRALGARWALRYPPHVTLRTGVIAPAETLPSVLDAFETILDGRPAFPLRAEPARTSRMTYEGAEHFFAFLPIVKDEPLVDLHDALLAYRDYRKSDKTRFEPHLTLLWDDLAPAAEAEARARLADPDGPFAAPRTWLCDNVSFYVQRGARWEPYHVIRLGAAKGRRGEEGIAEV